MNSRLTWFKSSYSDSSGSACLEVALDWRTSTFSDGPAAACVEVAALARGVHVRDSKWGAGSQSFFVGARAWTAFLARLPG
ncbi:DUF397 domain-containing protein [Streptomyces sp. NPDC006879]|uniref:DUF397 domain-containing protein n=1 Tax=Streptomyces sp. NPDC006879 TaxID=3364767 RepID=UPI00369AEC39